MREEKNSKCKCEVKPCLTENGKKGKGKMRKNIKKATDTHCVYVCNYVRVCKRTLVMEEKQSEANLRKSTKSTNGNPLIRTRKQQQ